MKPISLTYPFDLRETVILLLTDNLKNMDEIPEFIKTEGDDIIKYHHGLGTMIRNHYNLWDKKELEKYIGDSYCHPDDTSYWFMREAQNLMKELND